MCQASTCGRVLAPAQVLQKQCHYSGSPIYNSVSPRSPLTKSKGKKIYRAVRAHNIKARESVHWRAQCHAKWPRGSREFQHSSGIEPKANHFAGLSETHLNHSAIGLYQLPEKNSTGPTTGLIIFCQLHWTVILGWFKLYRTVILGWFKLNIKARVARHEIQRKCNNMKKRSTWNLQRIQTLLTLEPTQYCKSGSMFSSREPVAASSDCHWLGNTLCLCWLTQAAVRPQELGSWFCPLNLLALTLQRCLLTNELWRFIASEITP